MGEDATRGNDADNNREVISESGWVTTQQAAKALDITARTVRWHIEKGNIEAIPQGEGVGRTWLVSIDSLQAFRDSRQTTGSLPRTDRATAESADIAPAIPGDAIRELADRLVEEASKATEYRLRLELTEQAQSTLEEELAAERVRRDQAERERDELRRELEALRETLQAPEPVPEEPNGTSAETEEPERETESSRPSFWRRWFGGE